MSDSPRRILLVGHCTPDAFAMRMALGRVAPGVDFVAVNDEGTLLTEEDPAGLLVNRVLDGRFGTDSGLELIGGLDDATRRRTALVSDIPEAQAKAVRLGALPGFGKSSMYSENARACLAAMLESGS